MRQFASSLGHGKNPWERFMISSNRKAGFFQIKTQKRYSPYNCQALPVRCSQFLLFVIQSVRPIANGAVASVLLLLEEYKSDLLIKSIAIECVLACSSR